MTKKSRIPKECVLNGICLRCECKLIIKHNNFCAACVDVMDKKTRNNDFISAHNYG
jgi:hypothetical protein